MTIGTSGDTPIIPHDRAAKQAELAGGQRERDGKRAYAAPARCRLGGACCGGEAPPFFLPEAQREQQAAQAFIRRDADPEADQPHVRSHARQKADPRR